MENEKKKTNIGLIIIIIIVLLLLLFLVWYFLLRDKGTTSNNGGSGSEITDKPTDKKTVEYDYKDGVLTQIVDEEGKPLQTDFVINGLILVGNRHSYAGLEAEAGGIIEKLAAEGYKKTGINSSFYLNEWIEFYIDTDYSGDVNAVKILAVPHKTVEEYEKLSLEELAENNGGFILDYNKPDDSNYKYVGNGYINMDYPEGKYDILFTYRGKLAYFVELSLTKEQ